MKPAGQEIVPEFKKTPEKETVRMKTENEGATATIMNNDSDYQPLPWVKANCELPGFLEKCPKMDDEDVSNLSDEEQSENIMVELPPKYEPCCRPDFYDDAPQAIVPTESELCKFLPSWIIEEVLG